MRRLLIALAVALSVGLASPAEAAPKKANGAWSWVVKCDYYSPPDKPWMMLPYNCHPVLIHTKKGFIR